VDSLANEPRKTKPLHLIHCQNFIRLPCSAGLVDIYGAAFYKGKWYGKRLISSDIKYN